MSPSQTVSLLPSLRALARCEGCPVCGSREVARDEVSHGGPLQLAECARCRHRWTWRAVGSGRLVLASPAPRFAEVASAA
jgi:transcription elongation factor Elf1